MDDSFPGDGEDFPKKSIVDRKVEIRRALCSCICHRMAGVRHLVACCADPQLGSGVEPTLPNLEYATTLELFDELLIRFKSSDPNVICSEVESIKNSLSYSTLIYKRKN